MSRTAMRAVIFLLAASTTGSAQDPADGVVPELHAALVHGAQIRAMVEVCMQETPEVSGHLQLAYEDWLDRHPGIARELDVLRSGDASASVDPAKIEAETKQYQDQLRRELANSPDDFALRCDEFIKDLATGQLDHEPGKALALVSGRPVGGCGAPPPSASARTWAASPSLRHPHP